MVLKGRNTLVNRKPLLRKGSAKKDVFINRFYLLKTGGIMNYRYQILLCDQFIIMRWPSEGVDEDIFMEALIDQLNKYQTAVDFSVVAELLPTDDPLTSKINTIKYLEEAFNRDPKSLDEFDLWDFQGGKFVTIQRGVR
jgi:hypothetical protein